VPLINKLTEFNVCTIICGIDHLPQSYILPTNGHYSSSGNLFKQIAWTDQRKELTHQIIVKYKIINQAEILKRNNKKSEVVEKLYEYSTEVLPGDITNREGLAAKVYFRELFGSEFYRFDDDPINAGLNYGYAILRSLITSLVVAKGYLPNIGIFHKGKQNRFNLSDDLIEVFRPIVDNYVYLNMYEAIELTKENREELIQLTNKKITILNRKQTISNAMNIYFDSVFSYLNGETSEIPMPGVDADDI
jgi:CRISPR-associated protein Cas1